MSSYVFKFGTTTDLTVYPNVRFSPQLILTDTADELIVSTVDQAGVISLPALNATNGPEYNGKSVKIVLTAGSNDITINRLDANGDEVDRFDLTEVQDWAQVTAYWDATLSSGSWVITGLGALKDVRNAADTGATSAYGPASFA